MVFFRFLLVCLLLGLFVMFGQAFQAQQVVPQKPSYELKVGARNSTIRNIGSFQVDSALIFPKREAKDTLNNKTLQRKGAFFYDSMTHIVWFFDGEHFRRADSSIYNSDGVIETVRQVDIHGKDKAYLYFKDGSVHIDTLLIKKLKQGSSSDSVLVVHNDSVRRISVDSLKNIYTKDDSIIADRTVVLNKKTNGAAKYYHLHFKEGAVWIDTLLLKNRKPGTSSDSLLVVKNDSVYRIGRDSVFNIYNKSDSIRSARDVVLHSYDKSKKSQKYNHLYFKEGSVHVDTFLIKKLKQGSSSDSVLVVKNDSIKRISVDSLKNIYTKDDSIKSKRTVTLVNKSSVGQSLHFTKGYVHIDTLLLRKGNIPGKSRDSFLVRYKDTVKYLPFDSLRTIYNKDDSIREDRVVTIKAGKNKSDVTPSLKFKDGRVEVDTLLVRKRRLGLSTDTFLVVHKDTVRYIPKDSLWNIYNKNDSIRSARDVVLHSYDKSKKSQKYNHLYFKEGSVHIDTLLLKNHKKGTSSDSLLVVKNDSVYRIGRDSVFNIYNKSDSIREERIVTIKAGKNKSDVTPSLKFKDGRVEVDTLLVRKRRLGLSTDTFLVVHKDTVRYIPKDSLWNIYNKDDSIRSKRDVVLHVKKGNQTTYNRLYFKEGSVHIDTLLIKKLKGGSSSDSILVVHKDSVRRISVDSLKNIYTKNDSIISHREVVLHKKTNGAGAAKYYHLHFKGGPVWIDTLLLKNGKNGTSFDSVLVVKNDSVYRIGRDSVFNVYNKSDSIRSQRDVVLHSYDKKKNSQQYNHLYFKEGSVHVDTLLIRKLKGGSSSDSILVVHKDSVRRISVDSLKNIYTKDDSIISNRTVVLHKKLNQQNKYYHLHFKEGSVHIDTLLLKNKKLGTSSDSFLVRYKDTVKYLPFDSLRTIYNKSDSIRSKREVVLHSYDKSKNSQQYNHLYFKEGSVHIDTLLLKNHKKGTSFDSVLVVKNDSVYRIGRDSVFNIYNKSDSIKDERVVTIKARNSSNKLASLKFKDGRVEFDTIFLRGNHKVTGWDSVLVVKNDTVRKMYLGNKINIKNIYTNDDSIKDKRTVTLAAKNAPGKSLHFKEGSVWIDTLLLKNGKKGTSFDSLLVVKNDSVYRIGRDSVFNIYNKSDSIREERIVTIKARNGNANKVASLKFKDGRVEVDTLLVRKRRLGLSTDTLLVVHKDTVRYITKDSLWNIYTGDDSLRKTAGTNGKRTVYLNAKKLIFALGNHSQVSGTNTTNGADSGKIGIGQKEPVYTLDISTKTALREPINRSGSNGGNTTTTNGDYDSVAVRISHNVIEDSQGLFDDEAFKRRTRYGLLISEHSNKAFGRSAIGFYSDHSSANFVKARMWSQLGIRAKHPKFGIDVADSNQRIQTRLIIDDEGRVAIDTLKAGNSKLRIVGHGVSFSDGIVNISNPHHNNYLRLQAGWTDSNYSGIWLTEHNNTFGWKMVNDAKSDKFQLVKTDNNSYVAPTKDTILDIKRTGVTVLNVDVGSAAPSNSNSDSIALLIKHNVWEGAYASKIPGYTYGLMFFDSSNKANGRSAIGFLNGGHLVGTLNNATSNAAATSSTGTGGVAASGSTTTSASNGAFPAFMKARMWTQLGDIARHPKFGIDVSDSDRHIHTRMVIDHLGYVGIGVEHPTHLLDVKNGRTAVDTLLIRKKISGASSDSLLVMFKDTVRYITKDSLWNIYTGDDSLRKTAGTNGKRTVYLNAKKLVFALGNTTNNTTNGADSGKIGIGQKEPVYTLDIATKTSLSQSTGTNSRATTGSTANDYDSVAVRISHDVTENSGGTSTNEAYKARTRYGLLISEHSNKAYGRSAIGFYSDLSSANFVKARLWTQLGNGATAPKFGIDVADKDKQIQTRMIIDSAGGVGIDTLKTGNSKLRIAGKGVSFSDGIVNISNPNHDNYLHIQAGGTVSNYSGIWLTEHNNTFGWRMVNNAKSDKFQLVTTDNNTTSRDTILEINRKGAMVLNAFGVSESNARTSDSVALLIKHNVWEPTNAYSSKNPGYTYGLMLFDSSNKAYGRAAIGFLDGGNNVGVVDALAQLTARNIALLRDASGAGTATATSSGNFLPFVKARMWTELGSGAIHPKFGIDVADGNRQIQTRLTIDDSGLVKIGLNNENKVKLEINGRLKINSLENGNCGDSVLVIKNSVVKKICMRNTNCNTNCLSTVSATNIRSSNGANFLVSSGVQPVYRFYSSDSILKRGIVSLDGSLDRVLRLRPVTYYWKDSSSFNGFSPDRQFGFIAQEVRGVFPDLVKFGNFGSSSHLTLNYIGLIPPLVGAVQELYHTQKHDRQDYNKLQSQLQLLNKELNAVKEENGQKNRQISELNQEIKQLTKELNDLKQIFQDIKTQLQSSKKSKIMQK